MNSSKSFQILFDIKTDTSFMKGNVFISKLMIQPFVLFFQRKNAQWETFHYTVMKNKKMFYWAGNSSFENLSY